MSQTGKKCFYVSFGLHALLLGIVFFGSAFLVTREKSEDAKIVKVFNPKMLSDVLNSGGRPLARAVPHPPLADHTVPNLTPEPVRATPPPTPVVNPQPTPTPPPPAPPVVEPVKPKPAPVIDPPPAPKPEPTPVVKAAPKKTEHTPKVSKPKEPPKPKNPKAVKPAPPEEETPEPPPVKPPKTKEKPKTPELDDSDFKPIVKSVSKPTPPVEHPITRPVSHPTTRPAPVTPPGPDPVQLAAEEERKWEAKRRSAIESQLAAIGKTSAASPITAVDIPLGVTGDGGQEATNFRDLVFTKYNNAWDPPPELEDSRASTMVSITITPDGRVAESRVVKRSGNRLMDRSVEAALAKVTFIAPFPGGPAKRPRTYFINFNLLTKRSAA